MAWLKAWSAAAVLSVEPVVVLVGSPTFVGGGEVGGGGVVVPGATYPGGSVVVVGGGVVVPGGTYPGGNVVVPVVVLDVVPVVTVPGDGGKTGGV